MRADYRLFCCIVLAGSTCAGQEKHANPVWREAGVDAGLRQAFERSVYQLKDSGPGRYQGVNPVNKLAVEFNSDEARLRHPQGDAALRLTGYGYGQRMRMPLKATPTVSGNRVDYRRGELSEWYVNDVRGLEQGFTLASRPGAPREGESLVIALAVSGDLRPELGEQGGAVLLRSAEGTALRYSGLRAWDARGRALAASLQVGEREVRLVVEDRDAEYPLVVDPLWTQESELTGSDGKLGDNFGWSVSVNGDTAVIGAYTKKIGSKSTQGAAYVFVRSGGTWSQQQELTAADGVAGDWFGYSVSLNGNTAVVGAPQKTIAGNNTQGAAYVFVLTGSAWTQQQELTNSGALNFGWSVAVNGNAAVIGASGTTVSVSPNQGSAYVFVRSGSAWTQQQELTASNGVGGDQFGWSVALSGDTAVVGAVNKKVGGKASQGAAYVFARGGSTWTQQQELTSSDGAANDAFGSSVAVSGATVLAGAPNKTIGSNAAQGSAYVFTGSGGAWTQQSELTSSDGAAGDNFGDSVAASGPLALIGAVYKTIKGNPNQGAAYLFVGSGAIWSQQQELTSSDGASFSMNWFGSSVSLGGNTALVGATWWNSNQGSAYAFTLLTYQYTGSPFVTCTFGACPANYTSDYIVASLTFTTPLAANLASTGELTSSSLAAWTIGDALGYFSYSSEDANAAAELTTLSLSTNASSGVVNYIMFAGVGPTGGTVNPAMPNHDGVLITDFVQINFGTPSEWDAITATPGQWNLAPGVTTYQISQTGIGVSEGGVTGVIQTDGTIGPLSAVNIVSWDLVVYDGSTNTYDLTGGPGGNSTLAIKGNGLTATATQVLYNFGAKGSVEISNGPVAWELGVSSGLESILPKGTASMEFTTTVALGTAAAGEFFTPNAFFNGEQSSSVPNWDFLQFQNGNLFGYYTFLLGSASTANAWLFHADLGYEYVIPGSTSGSEYFYDLASKHWWFTSSSLFPYLYDFTLNTWIYYFVNTESAGQYTTSPRYFSNLTAGTIFTM